MILFPSQVIDKVNVLTEEYYYDPVSEHYSGTGSFINFYAEAGIQ